MHVQGVVGLSPHSDNSLPMRFKQNLKIPLYSISSTLLADVKAIRPHASYQ